MEILVIMGALVALAVLGGRYGFDSRDGLRTDEAARWQEWSTHAASRRGRLASLLAAVPLEPELSFRVDELHAAGARARLLGKGRFLADHGESPHRRAAYWLGSALMRWGRRLQELGQPACTVNGGATT